MLSEQDLSLGWALIEAWYELFPSPRDERKPFELTDQQALNIVEWYRVLPSGKFVYRRGQTRKSKKTGKSPLEAAKCISELRLEVRFDHWAVKGEVSPWGYAFQPGEPVGRPWGTASDPAPWVQIASLSEDQDENTYTPLYTFLTANESKLAETLRIDAGLTRCFLMDRADAKIEPVTSRAGSREGQPVTYGCLDESGLMTKENGGLKLARTLRRNTGGMGGRSYETTNGFMPGENSVAEGTHKSFEAGTSGILVDALEAPLNVDGHDVTEDAPDWVLRKALELPYTGCWWSDLDRLVADIRDPDMPWADAERFFFNWNRKGEGKAVDPHLWQRQSRPGVKPEPGSYIALGFDGSLSNDATALRGCTPAGHAFTIKVWERPEGVRDWTVSHTEVDEVVSETFATYRVGRMFCDPPKWWSDIETWAARWNPDKVEDAVVIFFDTNQTKRMSAACDRYLSGLAERTHDGDEIATRHVLAMAKKKVRVNDPEDDGRTRYVFVKADTRKIDAGIADVLAVEAAMTMPDEPAVREWFGSYA